MRYRQAIEAILAKAGSKADPRHVEGWMRVEHGTLDALGERRFAAEVRTALSCIAASAPEDSEELALSYGL